MTVAIGDLIIKMFLFVAPETSALDFFAPRPSIFANCSAGCGWLFCKCLLLALTVFVSPRTVSAICKYYVILSDFDTLQMESKNCKPYWVLYLFNEINRQYLCYTAISNTLQVNHNLQTSSIIAISF